ncbi:MAG: Ig-like domain-containing protein, partial [Deltaproteobacteria bacterium]|nr:Ig-like domain-containing protein [Deltaproteobacteria bacterium]
MLLTKKFLMMFALILAGLFLASCSDDSNNATNPKVVSLSPANTASGVNPNPILTIEFDRTVSVEQGNITIKNIGDDSTVEVI